MNEDAKDTKDTQEEGGPDSPKRRLRVPIWFWMLLFMAACLFGFGAYVVSTLI